MINYKDGVAISKIHLLYIHYAHTIFLIQIYLPSYINVCVYIYIYYIILSLLLLYIYFFLGHPCQALFVSYFTWHCQAAPQLLTSIFLFFLSSRIGQKANPLAIASCRQPCAGDFLFFFFFFFLLGFCIAMLKIQQHKQRQRLAPLLRSLSLSLSFLLFHNLGKSLSFHHKNLIP